MTVISIEATVALALACAQSFGQAVVREACDDLVAHAEVLELAGEPRTTETDAAADAARVDVAVLAGADPVTLPAVERVRFLQAALRLAAWSESRVDAAMLAIAGVTRRIHTVALGEGVRGEVVEIEDAARSEIALAARWSEAQAQARLESARLLHLLLPKTGAALACGAISHAHASVIAEGAARLAAGCRVDVTHPNTDRDGAAWRELATMAAELDRRATVIASRSTRSHTRAAVTRIVDSLDPEGMRRRRESAVVERDVWISPETDGNALLIARMGALQAQACLARVRQRAHAAREAAAAAGEVDSRRIGELRAQALAELLLGATSSSDDTAAQAQAPRLRADIDVVITFDALLGLQQIASGADTAVIRGPGGDELVPAAEIRDLLAHGDVTLRRLVTDPLTGHLLDVAPRHYLPSQRLRDFIEKRDVRCRQPGCTTRATRADLDHATPYDHGGDTVRANLGALCRRHHLLKTHEGYTITDSHDNGTCTIHTPTGLTYEHPPVPVIPDIEDPPF
jgi:hypothetical protein